MLMPNGSFIFNIYYVKKILSEGYIMMIDGVKLFLVILFSIACYGTDITTGRGHYNLNWQLLVEAGITSTIFAMW